MHPNDITAKAINEMLAWAKRWAFRRIGYDIYKGNYNWTDLYWRQRTAYVERRSAQLVRD